MLNVSQTPSISANFQPTIAAVAEPLVTNPFGAMTLPKVGGKIMAAGATKEAVIAQIGQEAVGTFAALFKGDIRGAIGSMACAAAGVGGMLGGALFGHLVLGPTGSLICSAFLGSLCQAFAKWIITKKSGGAAES